MLSNEIIANKLICPVCNSKVILLENKIKCLNNKCSIEYPVINNVPILINEHDSIFSIEQIKQQKTCKKNIKKKTFLKFINKIIPNISNNLSSKRNFKKLNELLKNINNPKILIIGGGEITQNTNMIIHKLNTVIESDIYFGPRTKIIIDGHHIPYEKEVFDLIIFQAVLEHVADPYQCIHEAHRVLKREGIIYAATPFMIQVHMKQYDFTRFTYLGHRRLFRHFKEIDSGVFAGTGVALSWSIRYFIRSVINNKYISFFIEVILAYLFFWLKYIDILIIKNPGIYDGAAGFYFIGEKSNTIIHDKELINLYRGKI